jgi:hypothetical protein
MQANALRSLLAGATFMLLAATQASAQLDFNFSSDVTPDSIAGSQGGALNLLDAVTFQTATCDDSLTPPGTDIVLLNLELLSGTDAGNPDIIGDGSYNILLTLQNPDTLNTASVNITGAFSGSFSATTANVNNVFGALPGPITIDGSTFTITELDYAPPSPPGGLLGAVTAHVTCVEDMQAVPEPGSIAMLLGFGVAGSGLAFRRRLRR